jgi:predicted RNase H-like HicB family nuclease
MTDKVKDLDYYMGLDWTLIEGTDLDFNGEPYHFIEIREFPNFVFCAKTKEKAREGYKHQLKLTIMIMLEDGERIYEPDEEIPEELY